jgi:hypothetical protein
MSKYALLVDGERVTTVDTAEAVRNWLVTYREEHVEDDPSAVHVQVIERGRFWWVTGGKLVDRLRFL